MPLSTPTRVDMLVAQSILLRGDDPGNVEHYAYAPSVCAHCKLPIKAEGQEVLQAVATKVGIYFKLKVACACGRNTGMVAIVHDDETEANAKPT